MGVTPSKPGFEEVLISPQVCDLKRAKGTWLSPKGNIIVKWERMQDIFKIECQLPKGLKGKLILPSEVFPIKTLKINGRKVEVKRLKGEIIQIFGSVKCEVVY